MWTPPFIARAGLIVGLVWSGGAAADGAFPDSLGILVPEQKPDTIYAAVNFGLLISQNGGADWDWVCEQASGTDAWQYTAGAGPEHLLYAVSLDGIRWSNDGACTWKDSRGPFLRGTEFDVFPAPVQSQRAIALGLLSGSDAGEFGAVESTNGGQDFSRVIYTASADVPPTGIEVARADSQRLWMTMAIGADAGSSLRQSLNGGQTWTEHEVGELAMDRLLLVAIDRLRPDRVLLRAIDPQGREWLGEFDATTGTARRLVQVPERMTAFVQRANGELLLGTAHPDGGLLISRNDGTSFTHEPGPHVRGIAERDGVLYAGTDNVLDGYAVGRSSDGLTWEPLLKFSEIRGPLACGDIPGECELAWALIKDTLGVVEPPGPEEPEPPKGCGCTGGAPAFAWVALALAAFVLTRTRRSSR